MWQKIRSMVMFGVACFTSPCCTPLIVPLGLGLLAGTPLAVWLSANLGWVYGVLTIISIVSAVLGLRWVGKKAETAPSTEMEVKTPFQTEHS
jgi:membrane protein implicated in regulation of membrane protease activity